MARPSGAPRRKARILNVIKIGAGGPPIRNRYLAGLLDCSISTICKDLREMQAAGLIYRRYRLYKTIDRGWRKDRFMFLTRAAIADLSLAA